MNLNAYDNVEIICNKTWVDTTYKRLYSNSIKFRPFYTLLSKYDSKTKTYNYYLALLDKIDNNFVCYNTLTCKNSNIKVDLSTIWFKCSLMNLSVGKYNINIEHIESTDDGDIYYLDI